MEKVGEKERESGNPWVLLLYCRSVNIPITETSGDCNLM